ncbi:MAG: DUF2336 domain-containing protein [Asticcacaulis sp.]|uniref:DUF2336 domain-containing protein n=1 Tax=Asticcacaulis sp. TaxID=1872648 RepID=UPI0039E3ED23
MSPLPIASPEPIDTAAVPTEVRPAVEAGRAGADIYTEEELIVRLCGLPVNLSAPLLKSVLPTLTPEVLLALIASTGESHHRLVAARPALDRRVIKALLRTQTDSVILALVRNPGLYLDEEDQAVVANRAKGNPGLRAALLESETLPIAKAHLRDWRAEASGHDNLRLIALLRGRETAGFVRELARRVKCDLAGLSLALVSESAVPLALSLRAAGLDRAVFRPVLALWQAANDGMPYMAESAQPLILSIFDLPAAEAQRRLATLINRAH